jgi:methylated-DNA-[protein]-cysteine S-methyltransferase
MRSATMAATSPVRLVADVVPTPIGDVHVISDGVALCALDFDDFSDRLHRLLQRRYGRYAVVGRTDALGLRPLLARYFAGDVTALEAVAADPGGTAYQRRVWDVLRTIPAGRTCSYGELAARVTGTHARAIGQANALNPVALVIPCHRVIGAAAALTGYAGGIERKRWLLEHEARHTGSLLPGL